MPILHPFDAAAASLAIEGLSLENGRDRIALYGNLDLTRDKAGLAHARALKAMLDEVVQVLEDDPKLPDAVPAPKAPTTVKNPFG